MTRSILMILFMPFLASAQMNKVNFKQSIWPIIENHCLDCHNDQKKHPLNKKPKGGLQLDTPDAIAKGGSGGPVVVAGKPAESSFYTLTVLAEDHEDVMPSKGDLLTPEQTAVIKVWIEQGADYGVKLKKVKAPVKKRTTEDIYDVLAQKVKKASSQDISYFERRGFYIRPVKEGSSLLKLDFLRLDTLTTEDFKKLRSLSEQLVYLNLARTNITDKDLIHLKSLKSLLFLHLENNKLSDGGLASLVNLSSLQYLNLVETKVSDKGLVYLKKLKSLKKLYLWKSKVTSKGANQLNKSLPHLKVNLGR